MRKLLSIAFCICIISSCSTEDVTQIMDQEATENTQINANNQRSEDEIISIATKAIEIFGDKTEYSRSKRRSVMINCKPIAIEANIARSSSNPLMYVVNYTDNNGYAIVSSNKNAPEVIAFAEEGHFTNLQEENNPGLGIYIQEATDFLRNFEAIDTLQPGNEKTVYFPDTLSRLGPNIDPIWEADRFIKTECPNGYSATANIALALFLQYYKYEGEIELTYKNDNTHIELDWDKIEYHFKNRSTGNIIALDNCSSAFPDYDIHKQLGCLIRELGYRSNTEYSTIFPSTPFDSLREAINSLYIYGLRESYVSKRFAFQNLSYYNLLFMNGIDETYGCQTWLCDGYLQVRQLAKRYITTDGGRTWKWDGETQFYTDSEYYNHFNWCCNAPNGYYLDLNFNPRRCPMDFQSNVTFWCIQPYGWISGHH